MMTIRAPKLELELEPEAERPTIVSRQPLKAVALAAIATMAGGCASVPEETVELSYLVGQDLEAMYRSYDDLVAAQFDEFRARRIEYLENEWIPAFLEDWVESGKLVETAKGEVVWSDDAGDFVRPTADEQEQQRLDTVLEWSHAAIEQIDDKRSELIDPLDEREAEIREDIHESFAKTRYANAQVTAHLNSIRKVQRLQDRATARLGADDLIADIDEAVADLSSWAADGLEKVRAQDARVTEATGSEE